jgi:hypothetical protein
VYLAVALVAACAAPSDGAPSASLADAGAESAASSSDSGGFEGGPEPELQNWLLSIGNSPPADGGTKHALGQISILPGDLGTVRAIICPNLVFGGAGVPNDVVSSLTFHEGVLYAIGASVESDGSKPAAALYRVDPCACTATRLGALGGGLGLVGSITSYPGHGLYGISSTNNTLFTVDPATGAGTPVKTMPVPFGASGFTWSGPDRNTLWGIESNSDSLYELDAKGDFAHEPLKLDYDFAGLGMEYHPGVKKLFACSYGKLLEVAASTGHVDVGPLIDWDGGCANLAAPFGPVGCVDNIR